MATDDINATMRDLETMRPRDMSDEMIKLGKIKFKSLLDFANAENKREDAVRFSNRFNDLEAERWVRHCRKRDAAPEKNATFYCFKESGKFYASERGFMPNIFGGGDEANAVWGNKEQREAILKANCGLTPGLSVTGSHYRLVVILDEDVSYGFPLCLEPL